MKLSQAAKSPAIAQAGLLDLCGRMAGRRYSLQRLKTSEPLVPPKPNEFDRA